MQNNPPREMSPSPLRDRQRTIKAQSMPLIPSVSQVFASVGQQPPVATQRQPSDYSSPSHSPQSHALAGRSPPGHHLPSPPRLGNRDHTRDHSSGGTDPDVALPAVDRPPIQQIHSQPILPVHPRPGMPRGIPPQFVRDYSEEITGSHLMGSPPDSTPSQSFPRSNSDPSALITMRSSNQLHQAASTSPNSGIRSSPKETGRQPRHPQEYTPEPSPKNDSAIHPSLWRQGSQRRPPPNPNSSTTYGPSPTSSSGGQPSAIAISTMQGHGHSPASHSPSANTRTPDRDRSLPVQEEQEDDVVVPANVGLPSSPLHNTTHMDSPKGIPNGRVSRAGHRDDDDGDDQTLYDHNSGGEAPSSSGPTVVRGGSSSEDSGYTPRSPSVSLPEHPRNYLQQGTSAKYPSTTSSSQEFPPRSHQGASHGHQMYMHKGRAGSTDRMGYQGIGEALVDNRGKQRERSVDREDGTRDTNGPAYTASQPRPVNQSPNLPSTSKVSPALARAHEPVRHPQQPNYVPPSPAHFYPEDYAHYAYPDLAFFQPYLHDTRPGAPIPPTPHSASAAPSPSPYLPSNVSSSSASNAGTGTHLAYPPHLMQDMLEAESAGSSFGMSPAPPAGSPYPHPFGHVMRQYMYTAGGGRNPPLPLNGYAARGGLGDSSASEAGVANPNIAVPPSPALPAPQPDHALIKEMKQQMIRQWHMYALNNSGNITDSTFSPSSTPANASHPGMSFYGANPFGHPYGGGYPYGGGANYNQWAQLHVNRTMNDLNIPDGADDLRSMQSSPSHEPLNARAPNDVGVRSVNKRFQPSRVKPAAKSSPLRNSPKVGGGAGVKRRVPARVASTQPRETSPEPDSSSGEETAGEEAGKFYLGPNGVSSSATLLASGHAAQDSSLVNGNGKSVDVGEAVDVLIDFDLPAADHPAVNGVQVPVVDDEDEEEGDWVDEDEDDEDDEDLLDLEFHPSYVRSSEKRRRRWEVKWANLVEAFHALDRQTASTLVLLAAPSHSKKLHSVVSRSIKRDPSLSSSTQFRGIRTSFSRLSNHQRAIKHSQKPQSLSALILSHAQTSPSIPPGSSSPDAESGVGSSTGGTSEREEELRRALQLTLGTLSVVGGIFEQREARFKEEIKRVGMDKATVAELVGRVLGVDPANLNLNHPNGNQSPPPHFAMNPAAYWQPDLPFPPGYAVPNGGEYFGQSEGEYVRRVPIRAVSSSELSEAGEENANGLASEVGDVGQAM